MKRLIVAGVLSAFIVVSLTFSVFYVKAVCNQTKLMLNECISAYDNNHKSYEKADALSNYWEKQEKILSIFVNHESLDEVESAIKSLKDYSDTEDNEIFYEYSGSVEMLIHQLLEDTLPGIHSIL